MTVRSAHGRPVPRLAAASRLVAGLLLLATGAACGSSGADSPDITDDVTAPDTVDAGDTFDAEVDVDGGDAGERHDADDADASEADDADASEPHDAQDPDATDADTSAPDADDADASDPDASDPDAEDASDPDAEDASDPDAEDASDPDAGDTSAPSPFDDLDGLTGAALRAALAARIDGHTALGYDGDGEAREVMFAVVDARDGRLECIYTGRTVAAEDPAAPPLGPSGPPIDTTPDADCRWPSGAAVGGGCFFNAEHSWPQSAGASNEPAKSDLHHLFPTWEYANNQRGSHPFGDTTCVATACPWHEGASELGVSASGATVFEVRPRYRGDVARAQFYFAVRYGKTIGVAVEQALRGWHADDPPDDVERARNDAIELWQHNRNPFVDRPDFVDAISDF